MIETITQMIQDGLKLDLLFTLVQLMVAAYALMLVKAFIVNEVAWRSFKGSLNICMGTWVRTTTSKGHVDGQIVEANRKCIIIETTETRIHIPTKTFPDRDWSLLKKAALKCEQNGEEK